MIVINNTKEQQKNEGNTEKANWPERSTPFVTKVQINQIYQMKIFLGGTIQKSKRFTTQ